MKNIVINGLSQEVLKTLLTESIDLVVTSPPYDNLRDYHKEKWNLEIFKLIAIQLKRVLKKGGIIVWVVGDSIIDGSESGTSFKQALFFKKIGLKLHDTMIYRKNCFANPSNNRYHQIFEYMFIFVKDKLKIFNPIIDKLNKSFNKYTFGKGRRQKNGKIKYQSTGRLSVSKFGKRFNIWKYNTGYGNITKDKIAYKHPAIFPEKLALDHILSWSNKNDIILDPFAGSGTTLKMAKYSGRNYIGIESSKEYIKIINERLKLVKFDSYKGNKLLEENEKYGKINKLSKY